MSPKTLKKQKILDLIYLVQEKTPKYLTINTK